MTCPHCQHELTDHELRRLWAQRNAGRQSPHPGPGRPRSCDCGTCKKCRTREQVRQWRQAHPK